MEEKTKNAFAFIEKVCAAYVGNLQDHQAIQSSLALIKSELDKPLADPENKAKK